MRIQMLFMRGTAAARLDAELRDHLERQIAENIAAGMSTEEARFAALRAFGNPALVREQTRGTWSWNWLELLLRDVRYGVRTLARTPGFASIAILVMALGIGANVALFTIVRSVLMKPLPFKDPDRLVRLYEQSSDGTFPFNQSAAGVFAAWKKQSRSFSDMAMSGYDEYNLSGNGGQLPEAVRSAVFTWNMLPTLGVEPALGRNFTADDDRPSANPTVLLSWGLWKRRYGGSASILNQTVMLDTKSYTVIGVMPAWFAYPDQRVQMWTPLYHENAPLITDALDDHEFTAVGRLKPGVTEAQALAEISVITRELHNQHLDNPFVNKDANMRPLLESIVGPIRAPLHMLLAATGCLLLIACLNVANLLVARSAARQKEHAIRAAMGGRRWDLLRQRLMESLLLAGAGGAAGLLLAWGALHWFASARQDVTRVEAIHIDGAVALFAVGLVAMCAAFAGLISSPQDWQDGLVAWLQESSRAHSGGRRSTRLRAVLLALEVGLTVMLLIGAGLLLKSYAKLRASDLGCITKNVLKMDFNLPEARYSQPACVTFFRELLTRVRSSPGIEGAGLVFPVVPGDGEGGDNGFEIAGRPPLPQGQLRDALHRWADPGYFAAIGIPILRGRSFDDNPETHSDEVIISYAFAQKFFAGEDPIGQHLITLGRKPHEIVGIVGDTRTASSDPPQPTMYFSIYMADWVYSTDYLNAASLVVRSPSDVTQLSVPVQRIFQQMDRDLPVSNVLTMDQVIGRNNMDASFNAMLLAVFAGVSLLLAAVGLFGVLSYLVAQRKGEIGIRIALGAQREQVLRKVLLDGLRPALVGLAIGLAGSAAAAREIASMLYGTEPLDAAVFGAVSLTLLAVAAAACVVPAWRASRLDPMQALRTE
ncbi:MAG TPA: ABC transporter permease [Terracidiphilus sp.]|nr:ABC transporter permease [Terracidiphilus sp.]